jgi:ClpP class serine protease
MIAAAADEIIADPNSIVGSIGVVSSGFGFTGLIDKLGIERRVHTSGRQKAMLDPFQPEKPDDVEHLKALQAEIHAAFVDLVKSRRPHLAADEDLFTGAFWTAVRGRDYGLVDGLGDLHTVLRQRFGADVRVKVMGQPRGFLRRRLGMAAASAPGLAGASVDAIMTLLEERALWGRFGR